MKSDNSLRSHEASNNSHRYSRSSNGIIINNGGTVTEAVDGYVGGGIHSAAVGVVPTPMANHGGSYQAQKPTGALQQRFVNNNNKTGGLMGGSYSDYEPIGSDKDIRNGQRSNSTYSATTPWDIFRIIPIDTKDFDESNALVDAFKQISKLFVYLITFLLVLLTTMVSMGALLIMTANLNADNFARPINLPITISRIKNLPTSTTNEIGLTTSFGNDNSFEDRPVVSSTAFETQNIELYLQEICLTRNLKTAVHHSNPKAQHKSPPLLNTKKAAARKKLLSMKKRKKMLKSGDKTHLAVYALYDREYVISRMSVLGSITEPEGNDAPNTVTENKGSSAISSTPLLDFGGRLPPTAGLMGGIKETIIALDPFKSASLKWLWAILISICTPYIFIFIRSLRQVLFHTTLSPSWSLFGTVFTIESFHTIGICLFVLKVLPNIDSAHGIMITHCFCIVPGLLHLFSRFSSSPNGSAASMLMNSNNKYSMNNGVGNGNSNKSKIGGNYGSGKDGGENGNSKAGAKNSNNHNNHNNGGKWYKITCDIMSLTALIAGLIVWPFLVALNPIHKSNYSNDKLMDNALMGSTINLSTAGNISSTKSIYRGGGFGKHLNSLLFNVRFNGLTWAIPLSAFLISLTWWENFIDKRGRCNSINISNGPFAFLSFAKEQLKRSRAKTYVFVSLWKVFLTVCIISGYAFLVLDYNFFDMGTIFEAPIDTLKLYRKHLWPLFNNPNVYGTAKGAPLGYLEINDKFITSALETFEGSKIVGGTMNNGTRYNSLSPETSSSSSGIGGGNSMIDVLFKTLGEEIIRNMDINRIKGLITLMKRIPQHSHTLDINKYILERVWSLASSSSSTQPIPTSTSTQMGMDEHAMLDVNYRDIFEKLRSTVPTLVNIYGYQEKAARLGITREEHLLGATLFSAINISPATVWLLVIAQVFACLVCYYVSKFTCKVMIQEFSFALPLTLAVPVTLSFIVATCEMELNDPCSVRTKLFPENIFWKCYPGTSYTKTMLRYAWIWGLWVLAQLWITVHIWFPKVERLAKTDKLFISPMYCPVAIVQSLSLNRRRDRKTIYSLRRAFMEDDGKVYGIYDEEELEKYDIEDEDGGGTDIDSSFEGEDGIGGGGGVKYYNDGSRASSDHPFNANNSVDSKLQHLRRLKQQQQQGHQGIKSDLEEQRYVVNGADQFPVQPPRNSGSRDSNNIYASIESLENQLEAVNNKQQPKILKTPVPNGGAPTTDLDATTNIGIMSLEDINSSDDSTIRIYICATMWHETADEMTQVLKSIFRMDEDQSARRKAEKFLKVADPDYYEFEAHIFVDEAFEDNDKGQRTINSFVKQLIGVVDIAASAVHRTPMRLAPPKKYLMAYGGKLIWNLPGRNTLNVHLKDRTKIRNKKRWSQVMYMYYLLGQRLWVQIDDIQRKQIRADNTFILTLDGDVDVKPASAQLLIDLMKKNLKVGAACGRIHPVGSGPMVWYQKFEYAIGHWFQKATEHMIGCVLCSPGCFSLFRASALMDDNVMRKYASKSEKAMHYVQYDQGEDRWLSTLLLQQGYRVEYCAAADAFTHAPEGFFEFYNQRRRWIPSTLANILDLLCSHTKTVQMNDSISMAYIAYQWALLACALIGPGTIFLMIVGAVALVFHINLWKSFALNLVPIIFFVFTCLCSDSETQLLIAAFLSACYALLMISVSVGISVQITDDGLTSPSSIFLFVFVGCFFVAALLHPQEFWNIAYGILYFLSIPAMYLLLIIYSLTNLHIVQWGTREVPGAEKIDRFRANRRKRRLHEVAKSKWRALKLKYLYDNLIRRQLAYVGDKNGNIVMGCSNTSKKNTAIPETRPLLLPNGKPAGSNVTSKLDNLASNLQSHEYIQDLINNSPTRNNTDFNIGMNNQFADNFLGVQKNHRDAIVMNKLSEFLSSSDDGENLYGLESGDNSGDSDYDTGVASAGEDEGFAFNCGTLCRLTCCSRREQLSKKRLGRYRHTNRHRYKSLKKLLGFNKDNSDSPFLLEPLLSKSSSRLMSRNDNDKNNNDDDDDDDGDNVARGESGRSAPFIDRKSKQVRIRTDIQNNSSPSAQDKTKEIWISDKCLKKGELVDVSTEEETFWRELIDTYLYPLDEDEEHKIQIKTDLKSLRNKVILGFYMVNACFILIIFLLQLRKDKIYIIWPWGKKSMHSLDFLGPDEEGGDEYSFGNDLISDLEFLNNEYLKLEPIALVFLVVFMFLLITQFLAMLAHRFSTFQLILATTEISLFKCWNRKRGLARFRSGLRNRNHKSGGNYPPQLTAEQAVALVRELQKLEGLDDEIEYEAVARQEQLSMKYRTNSRGRGTLIHPQRLATLNGSNWHRSYLNNGFQNDDFGPHQPGLTTFERSGMMRNGVHIPPHGWYPDELDDDIEYLNGGEVYGVGQSDHPFGRRNNFGRRSVARNLAKNMSIRADGKMTTRKYTTNTLDAAFAKRFLALSEKINNNPNSFLLDPYHQEALPMDYDIEDPGSSKVIRQNGGTIINGCPKDIKNRHNNGKRTLTSNGNAFEVNDIREKYNDNNNQFLRENHRGPDDGHNEFISIPLHMVHNETNNQYRGGGGHGFNNLGVIRADRNTLRVLANKKDTIFRRDILEELKKETLKLNPPANNGGKHHLKTNGKPNNKNGNTTTTIDNHGIKKPAARVPGEMHRPNIQNKSKSRDNLREAPAMMSHNANNRRGNDKGSSSEIYQNKNLINNRPRIDNVFDN